MMPEPTSETINPKIYYQIGTIISTYSKELIDKYTLPAVKCNLSSDKYNLYQKKSGSNLDNDV